MDYFYEKILCEQCRYCKLVNECGFYDFDPLITFDCLRKQPTNIRQEQQEQGIGIFNRYSIDEINYRWERDAILKLKALPGSI